MSYQQYEYHVEFSGVPCNLCFDIDAAHIGKTLVVDGKALRIKALHLNYDKQVLHLHYSAAEQLDPPETFWTSERIGRLADEINFYHNLYLQQGKSVRVYFLKPILAITLGLLLVGMMLIAPLIPEALMIAGVVVGALATLYMALPTIRSFIKGLGRTKAGIGRWLSMDAVYLLASLIMFGVSIAAFFVPGLPMMMEAGLLLFGFKALGEVISAKIRQQHPIPVRFSDSIPNKTTRLNEDDAQEIDTVLLQPDDQFSLPRRKYCPVDAVLEGEQAVLVDESRLNGQSEPVIRQPGQILYQGSAILDAEETRLRVLRTSQESYLAKQDALLLPKNPAEQASRILRVYLPAMVVLALLVALVLGLTLGLIPALKIGLFILVSACPCALSLASALENQYAERLVQGHKASIKPGSSLAALTDIDTVMLDINGTLTEGRPSVRRFELIADDESSRDHLLARARQLEELLLARQEHPVARAIAEYCANPLSDDLPSKRQDTALEVKHNGFFDTNSGYGLGNADFWRARGLDAVPVARAAEETNWVYLGTETRIIGFFALGDALRQGVVDQLEKLQAAGKKLYLATGASVETAEVYRQALSMPPECVRSSLASDDSEHSKLSLLRQLQHQGRRVLFVGDGENDTQALAQADMSIAIKNTHRLTTAQTQADVVLSDYTQPQKTWSTVGGLFQDARQVGRVRKQNMALVLGLNLASIAVCVGLVLGLGLALNPWVMALAMVLQMVVVIANTLRQNENGRLAKAPEKPLLPDTKCPYQPLDSSGVSVTPPSLAYGLTRL